MAVQRCYPKQAVEHNVLDASLQRLRLCFDRYDKVAVAFSGGKDSTVCLQLALQVAAERGRLPLDCYFWDEECIPPETIEYVERIASLPTIRMKWLCMPVLHRNACSRTSPWWHPWADEDRPKWVRPLPPRAITSLYGFTRRACGQLHGVVYPPDHGRVCLVTGIRTEESLHRLRAITTNKQGPEAFFAGDESKWITKAFVIYDWSTPDVWLAPQVFGWDYNRTYDLMSAAGVSLAQQRVAPPWGEDPSQRLWMFKTIWPELWAKMCYRVPGAATCARYSRTELYGFGALSDPADGLSWQDQVHNSLLRFEGTARQHAAQAVHMLMSRHQANTDRPMPDTIPDPHTGICWRKIAQIALRGDLKGRRVRVARSKARPNPTVKH